MPLAANVGHHKIWDQGIILAIEDEFECAFLPKENQQQIGALESKVLQELKVEYRAISDFLVRNSLTKK
jgi:hypothetical protein